MSNKNENQSIILSFIVGAAAGLAAGILIAPETGEETRRNIAQKANTFKDKAKEKANTLKDQANTLKDQAKEKANTLKEQVGSKINDTINKISKSDKTASIQKGGKNSPNIDIVN